MSAAALLIVALQTSSADTAARMEFFNQALGVGCAHCHVANDWSSAEKPQFSIARNMMRMVDVVNERLRGIGSVSCRTCHAGQITPSRLPRADMDAVLAKWPAEIANAPDAVKNTMAVYTATLATGCDHCHTATWSDRSKPTMKTVKVMGSLFEEFPKYMPATARTQCYMCHKGTAHPQP